MAFAYGSWWYDLGWLGMHWCTGQDRHTCKIDRERLVWLGKPTWVCITWMVNAFYELKVVSSNAINDSDLIMLFNGSSKYRGDSPQGPIHSKKANDWKQGEVLGGPQTFRNGEYVRNETAAFWRLPHTVYHL